MTDTFEVVTSPSGIVFRIVRPPKNSVHCSNNARLPKVLALHGWMGDGYDLIPLSKRLANTGIVVFVPDLPFHGASLLVTANSCEIAAKKVMTSFLQVCTDHSFSLLLVGYSMGGRLALIITQKWDELVNGRDVSLSGAVFVSSSLPPICDENRNRMRLREQQNYEEFSTLTSSNEFDRWLRSDWYSKEMWGNIIGHSLFDRLVCRRVQCFNEARLQSWANALLLMATSTMNEFFERNQISPVLYLYGTLDAKYKAMRVQYQRVFSDARCVPIDNCGHNVILQALDRVSISIISFCTQRCLGSAHFRLSALFIETLPYTIELTKQMSIANYNIDSRRGFLLKIVLINGCSGVSDIVPLTGWHNVSIDEARAQVDMSMAKLRDVSLCPFCFLPDTLLNLLSDLSPLIANAIEAAIIQGLAKSIGSNLIPYIYQLRTSYTLLEPKPISTTLTSTNHRITNEKFILINGVLPRPVPGVEDDERLVNFFNKSRFSTLKIKVGAAANVRDDVNFVQRAARLAASRHKLLRLDANQSWDLNEWYLFRDGLGETWSLIEFIEEPLKLRKHLLTVLNDNDHYSKIALDETVAKSSLEDLTSLLALRNCCALVVKPTMFRSIGEIFELCSVASANNKRLVFSSTFESGVGLAWQSNIIIACCYETFSREVHHGLGTYAYLKQDVIEPQFKKYCVVQDNKLDVDKCTEYLELAAQLTFDYLPVS